VLIAALQKKHANGSTGFFDELATLQVEWFDRGRDKGLSRDLEVSIALAEVLIETAGSPDQLGAAYNSLGNALSTLGEREPGTARVEAAVAAFTEALKEFTPDRGPLQWAMSWGNQGQAMSVLADRTNDLDLATTALRQLTEAEAQMRAGGHIPFADYYAMRLADAQALVKRLTP
jgi:tetratricopeptide (TPR) repeat protein